MSSSRIQPRISARYLAPVVLAFVLVQGMRQAIHDSSVPTLRLRATGLPPDLPTTSEKTSRGRWHIFLSHAWSTGQDQANIVARQLTLLMPTVKIWLDVDCMVTRLEPLPFPSVLLPFPSDFLFTTRDCHRPGRRGQAGGECARIAHCDHLPQPRLRVDRGSNAGPSHCPHLPLD